MEVMDVFDYAAAAHFMDNVVVGHNFHDLGAPVERTFETWKALIQELETFLRRTNQLSPSVQTLLPLLRGTPTESFEMLPMSLRVSQVCGTYRPGIDAHAVILVRMGDRIGICNSGYGLDRYHAPDRLGFKISVFFGIDTPSASELWTKIKSLYERVSGNLPIDVVYMLIMSHTGSPFVPTDDYFSKPQHRGTCAFRSFLAFMRFVALNSGLPRQEYKQLALNLRTCHFEMIINKALRETTPWPRYYVSSIDRLCFQLARQAEKLPGEATAEFAFDEIEKARGIIEQFAMRDDLPIHWNTTKMPSLNSLVGFLQHVKTLTSEATSKRLMSLDLMERFYDNLIPDSFYQVMASNQYESQSESSLIYQLILSFWLKNADVDRYRSGYLAESMRFSKPILTWPQTFKAMDLKLSFIKEYLEEMGKYSAASKLFFENMIANLNSLFMNPQLMLRQLCGVNFEFLMPTERLKTLIRTYLVEPNIYQQTGIMIKEIDKYRDSTTIITKASDSSIIEALTSSILSLYSFQTPDKFYDTFVRMNSLSSTNSGESLMPEYQFPVQSYTEEYGDYFTVQFERLAGLLEERWTGASLDGWFENAVENFINFPTTQSHAVYNKWNQFLIMVPAYLKSEVGGIKHSVAPYNLTLDKLAPKIRQLVELRDSPSNIFELLCALRPLASEFVQWDQALLSQISDYAQQPFASEDFIVDLIDKMHPPSQHAPGTIFPIQPKKPRVPEKFEYWYLLNSGLGTMVFIWEKLGARPDSPLLRAIFRACTLFVSISSIPHTNEFKHKLFTVTPEFVGVFVQSVLGMHIQENAQLVSKKWRIHDFKLERDDSDSRSRARPFDDISPYKITTASRTSDTMSVIIKFDSLPTELSVFSTPQGGNVHVADRVDESGSVTTRISAGNFVFSNSGLPLACMFNTPRLKLALGVDYVRVQPLPARGPYQTLVVSVKAADSSILGTFTVDVSQQFVVGFFMLGGVKYHYDSRWDKSILRPLYSLLPENNFILLRRDDEGSATRVLVVLPGAPVWKISADKLEIETGEVFGIRGTRKPLIQNMTHFGILEVSGKLLGLPGAFSTIESSQNNENELFYPRIEVNFANAPCTCKVLGEVVVQKGIEVTSALEVGVRMTNISGNDHFRTLAATSFAQMLQHTVPTDYVFLGHTPTLPDFKLPWLTRNATFDKKSVLLFTKPTERTLYETYSSINYQKILSGVISYVLRDMNFIPDMCLNIEVFQQAQRFQSSVYAAAIRNFKQTRKRLTKMKTFLEKNKLMTEPNQFYYMKYKTTYLESKKCQITIMTEDNVIIRPDSNLPILKREFDNQRAISNFFDRDIGIKYHLDMDVWIYVTIRDLQ